MQEATKAIKLEPRREVFADQVPHLRQCPSQLFNEARMLEGPPIAPMYKNQPGGNIPSVGTEEVDPSEPDVPLSSSEDLDEEYTLASNNSLFDDDHEVGAVSSVLS